MSEEPVMPYMRGMNLACGMNWFRHAKKIPNAAWVILRERLVALRFLSFLAISRWPSLSDSLKEGSSLVKSSLDGAEVAVDPPRCCMSV